MAALTATQDRNAVRVGEIMHVGLVTCPPDVSLEAVAATMTREGVHCIVITDGDGGRRSVWGIVSDLDLIAAASVRPLAEQKAGGSALRPAVTIGPDASLEVAARTMTKAGVAHLMVVDPVEQRPIGMLSTLDLAGAFASE